MSLAHFLYGRKGSGPASSAGLRLIIPTSNVLKEKKKDHPEIEPMLQIWAAEFRSKALLEVPVVDNNSNLGIRGGLAMERSIIKIMLCSLNRNFSTCNTYIL